MSKYKCKLSYIYNFYKLSLSIQFYSICLHVSLCHQSLSVDIIQNVTVTATQLLNTQYKLKQTYTHVCVHVHIHDIHIPNSATV